LGDTSTGKLDGDKVFQQLDDIVQLRGNGGSSNQRDARALHGAGQMPIVDDAVKDAIVARIAVTDPATRQWAGSKRKKAASHFRLSSNCRHIVASQ
jgi:hypothetical protein